MSEHLMNTYGKHAITLSHGEGIYVWDTENRRYLDAISGIAVCGLGHAHPEVTQAISEQAQKLLHCSNLYGIEPQQKLGEKLTTLAGMDKAFFSNSGAEANEAALKIARKYGQQKGIAAPEIITADKSFHGRTMGTLSATGNTKVKAGFEPLLPGFQHVEYGSISAIHNAESANTVAVMVEPVQGEGGVNVPYDGYLRDLRVLCDENDWLLILDEIQTGNGRTGELYAFQHEQILPDVFTTAKGLGNGFPIGACLAQGKAAEILQPGNHGSTFGGNPLATHTALTVLEIIESEGLAARAKTLGVELLNAFKQRLANIPGVIDIRGKGLMIGIELNETCGELVAAGRAQGILINVTGGNVIRLLPPLIMTDQEAESVVSIVCSLIETR